MQDCQSQKRSGYQGRASRCRAASLATGLRQAVLRQAVLGQAVFRQAVFRQPGLPECS